MTYRDLGANPIPHLDAEAGLARNIPADQQTPAQAASWRLSQELVDEILAADTILLGLPLYNFGPPGTVKTGSTTSWRPACRWTRRPARACSAAATCSCSPPAAAATRPARPARAGTTRSRGWHTA